MKLAGRQVIDGAHPCLAGHFPDQAIAPAVVLRECVPEALEDRSEQNQIITISSGKFLTPLKPDQPFSIYLGIALRGRVRFECRAGERVIARGELEVGGGGDPAPV
ncbi:MAG: hydroxymyristoyl-ACP dehydratase [Gammaproteobacteria bacterium]